MDPGKFQPEKSLDPVLRLMLWDAAALVPGRTDAWRGVVKDLDEEDFVRTKTLLPDAREYPQPATEKEKATAEKFKDMSRPGTVLITSGGSPHHQRHAEPHLAHELRIVGSFRTRR